MKPIFIALTALIVLASTFAWAQSGGVFEIRRSSIDTGAGVATGAGYQLSGTIGQHDPGLAQGGLFDVRGGFWASATAPSDVIFQNGFEL